MEVKLEGITKSFGALKANDGITLEIPAGTIQGILGENGAGKSTLMKILSGYFRADGGRITLGGTDVTIKSPSDAIAHGVGMLHQDPLDFPTMSTAENFLVGGSGGLRLDRRAAKAALREYAGELGFSLLPEAPVDGLTIGERQQLEMVRLLSLGARVLILDEPTTGISAPQKARLFETLKLLAERGHTIIFVSHKLEEVEEICHRAAVLRHGRLVGRAESPYDVDGLVRLMFGKAVTPGPARIIPHGHSALTLDSVSIETARARIEDFNLEVKAGETIGLAGMEGSGQDLLLKACAGLIRTVAGRLQLNGIDMTGKPYRSFREKRVAYVPASRLEEGLIPTMSLTDHFLLSHHERGVFVDWAKGRKDAQAHIDDFNIKGSPATAVESLSGGNQQRALLALLRTPLALLLLEQPTRGLDVESTIYIWSKLKDRCMEGAAILFLSSDLDEVLQYSDRIIVFFNGHFSTPLTAAETTVEQLGNLIGGRGV
jgi:simple sugar transport system ATP-binding protein